MGLSEPWCIPEPLIFRVKPRTMRFILPVFVTILLLYACTINESKKETGKTADPTQPYVFSSGLTEDTACLLSQVAYFTRLDSILLQYMPGWFLVWEGKEANGNHAFVASNGRDHALAIRGSLINFSWAAFQNWIYQDLHVTTQEKWPFAPTSLEARVPAGSHAFPVNRPLTFTCAGSHTRPWRSVINYRT